MFTTVRLWRGLWLILARPPPSSKQQGCLAAFRRLPDAPADPAILASMKTPDKPDASTFERFTKVLRALVAVPKAELDQALAKEERRSAPSRDCRNRLHDDVLTTAAQWSIIGLTVG